MLDDATITAISTPPGKSAIAIVRLSGAKALDILDSVFVDKERRPSKITPFRPSLGYVYERDVSNLIDQVIVTYFQKPHSYTGEDVLEISCHGSPVAARKILELLIAHGARLASPGEFTMRAFLNGKMDLTQAEAVRDLIESRTLYQARLATQQLQGSLSKKLQPVKEALIDIACHLESKVEFVEEDIQTVERERLIERIDRVLTELRQVERSFEYGKIVHDGITLAIVGRPNVGKSSLFNALLYEDRAIVTEIPGTTRDMLVESINICGIPVRFIDTAGIREGTSDVVEKLGIERSLSAISNADLVLFVVDASERLHPDDYRLREKLTKLSSKYLVVLNKTDLPVKLDENEIDQLVDHTVFIRTSAKEKMGIEELRQLIFQTIAPHDSVEEEDLIITNVRHKECISKTIDYLQKAQEALRAGLSEEFALYDFHQAHKALGEITGETTIEDILTKIFSTFCIGK